MALLLSLTAWIESIVSFRALASYLLGLVVYDEVFARSELRPDVKDEILEVEVGEKLGEENQGFRFDRFVASLAECTTKSRAKTDGLLKTSAFLASCDYICGFILVFGRATSFAASTVTGYISTIDSNLAAWPVPAGSATDAITTFTWKEQSVQVIIQREVDQQIAMSGGKKKPSCSRCVLRLMWFIEFVEACVRYTLIENRDESCSAGASKAYEETIGVRHPWLIRKGVISAMSSLPTRSAVIEALHLHDLSPEEAIAQLRVAQTHMKAMLTELHSILKQHGLLDIK
ncbi:hypothetical protein P43SY_005618 [Pythium insidiosum]|uniref:Glycolipid transfer protein domain-containing protein n=1 Tax=Pythium insidiosum TaxID=114742 RepID=A0AAD5LUX0_PYTIN|nr:hypothetical protein P43SY_005618 [Pythium insidiosum]